MAVHPTIGVHHVLVRRVFGPVHVVNALKSDYGSASQNMCFKKFLFLVITYNFTMNRRPKVLAVANQETCSDQKRRRPSKTFRLKN